MRLCLLLLLFLVPACGKRAPDGFTPRLLVLTGTVVKIERASDMKVKDGTLAMHTATVKVSTVEKSEEERPRPGDTVRVQWMQVAKPPTNPIPGVQAFDYGLKEQDEARFRLESLGSPPYAVSKRKDGIEVLKREGD